jgi:hypothetical protein
LAAQFWDNLSSLRHQAPRKKNLFVPGCAAGLGIGQTLKRMLTEDHLMLRYLADRPWRCLFETCLYSVGRNEGEEFDFARLRMRRFRYLGCLFAVVILDHSPVYGIVS